MNEFHQVSGYKINTQNLVAFLYTEDDLFAKKNLVYNVSKTKYLRLNLIKGVRNLDIKTV